MCWRSLALALAAWAALPTTGTAGTDTILARLGELRAEAARAEAGRLPVRVIEAVTGWQVAPLYLVLSEREESDPESYAMTTSLFAFEWGDGRLLVVDAGLALSEAESFGKPTQLLGAGPTHCNPRAWEVFRAAPRRIEAILFTHLHSDHTNGVLELCRGGKRAPVRLSPEQRASAQFFEQQGREQLEAMADRCVRFDPWQSSDAGGGIEALPGFPGAYRVAVPGHTPGSQLVVGFARDPGGSTRATVLSGDVVNHRLGFERDVPKPWWYRWIVVREDEDAQREHRRLLRGLVAAGFDVKVSHHLPGAIDGLEPGACASGAAP